MVSKNTTGIGFKALEPILTKDVVATRKAILGVVPKGVVNYNNFSDSEINEVLGALSSNVSFSPTDPADRQKASALLSSIFANNLGGVSSRAYTVAHPATPTTSRAYTVAHPATPTTTTTATSGDNFWDNLTGTIQSKLKNVLKNPSSPYPGNATKFNLPPHLTNRLNATNRSPEKGLDPGFRADTRTSMGLPRRGMIWWDSSAKLQSSTATDAASVAADNAKDGTVGSFYGSAAAFNLLDHHMYGVSFMFNPSQVTIVTGVDTDHVPTQGDMFLGDAGDDYQGAQELTLTLFFDRSVDFAYLNALARENTTSVNNLTAAQCRPLARWYVDEPSGSHLVSINPGDVPEKIAELAKRGTMHDIDYLYSTVNGRSWKRWGAGEPTGDIGFLYYTLVYVSIGVHIYAGVIRSIQVDHTKFLENMTPIQSTVNLSIQLRATATSTVSTPITTSSPRASGQTSGR